MSSFTLLQKAKEIKALVLDVDGILSDGFITLTNAGDEIKSFDIRDGFGMKLLKKSGIKIIIITGKVSHIVDKRMKDLNVDLVFQGREDKGVALQQACEQMDLEPEECLYMGDDWPDLSAFALAGLSVTVPNGHIEVRRRADLVTQAYGGRGAVREVCDLLLEAKGEYASLLDSYLNPNQQN